ncbi:MAG TPA: GIY-YIG nuclease family protein [Sphingomicrobium sp.]|nr:GIY-YIG nuclease family protein [Sphingomicrobium sp.]
MKPGWVYMMTNAPFGTLYIGVTSDIAARVWQHRNGQGSRFCKQYGLTRLVYVEQHERIDEAIAREKAMKAWKRRWKTELIEKTNPGWDDLFDRINW